MFVVVVFDEASDLLFEFPREIVFLQVDLLLHRSVIPFDLPLCHRMIRRTVCRCHSLVLEKVFELLGDIRRSVVREEPWTMPDRDVLGPRFLNGDIQQIFDVCCGHCRVELPGDDIP